MAWRKKGMEKVSRRSLGSGVRGRETKSGKGWWMPGVGGVEELKRVYFPLCFILSSDMTPEKENNSINQCCLIHLCVFLLSPLSA